MSPEEIESAKANEAVAKELNAERKTLAKEEAERLAEIDKAYKASDEYQQALEAAKTA